MMALVIGKERALRLKRFLSTTNEEELLQRHNREIDLRLWQRFAADVEAEGASLKDRGEDRAGAMPPYIIHPHSKWKTSWDIFIVAMVVLHTVLRIWPTHGHASSRKHACTQAVPTSTHARR